MTVVGRMGNFIKGPTGPNGPRGPRGPGSSWPLCRVHDRRLGAGTVRERGEVHVVAGSGADRAQQGAVHPRDERSIELAGALETLAVLVHLLDEDVLHLQV